MEWIWIEACSLAKGSAVLIKFRLNLVGNNGWEIFRMVFFKADDSIKIISIY
jgi:hypothetical protein